MTDYSRSPRGEAELARAIFLLDKFLEDGSGNPLISHRRKCAERAISTIKGSLAAGLALVASESTVCAVFEEARRTSAEYQALAVCEQDQATRVDVTDSGATP